MKTKIETIRHSLAHIMALAIQDTFPNVKFGIGPAIENGFYYDFDLSEKMGEKDLEKIAKKMRKIIKIGIKFEKKIISKQAGNKLFAKQPYKLQLIKEIPDKNITIYKTGDFSDLCKGPHVKSSQGINPDSFKLTKIAGAYWKGDEKNPMLTRIYGIAFETEKELEKYIRLQAEAEKRDHRVLGK